MIYSTFEDKIDLIVFCTAVAGLILLLLFYLVVQVLTFIIHTFHQVFIFFKLLKLSNLFVFVTPFTRPFIYISMQVLRHQQYIL